MDNYINMEYKTCIFGYGAIDVGVVDRTIIFKEIKPPKGAGTRIWNKDCTEKVGDWEYTGNELFLKLNTIEDVENVYEQLKKIEANRGGFVVFDCITLEFTEYKQESMNIVKSAVNQVRRNILCLMAC